MRFGGVADCVNRGGKAGDDSLSEVRIKGGLAAMGGNECTVNALVGLPHMHLSYKHVVCI